MKTSALLVASTLIAFAGAAHAQPIQASDVVRVNFEPAGTIAGEIAGRIRFDGTGQPLRPQASVPAAPTFNTSNLIGGTGASQITAANSSLFLSFCVERIDFASPNVHYSYRLSDSAAFGGANNPTPTSGTVFNPLNSSHVDRLSYRSAYLFRQFWDATLTGYDFNGSGRANDANSLQMAFWLMEGELQLPQFSALSAADQTALTGGGFNATNYNLVRNMLIGEANANGTPNLSVGAAGQLSLSIDRWVETLSFLNLARLNANSSTDYGVRVLNLWTSATTQTWDTRGQDYMVVIQTQTSIIPLPPSSMAGLGTLLGLGAASVCRRRSIAK